MVILKQIAEDNLHLMMKKKNLLKIYENKLSNTEIIESRNEEINQDIYP